MIGKLTKGQTIYGLLTYLLGEKDQKGDVREMARVIGGTVDGDNVNELCKNFMLIRSLKPNLKTYVVNESLRLKEGQKLESQQWAELADSWAQGLGFDTYSIIQHSDSEVHIAALRIRADGTTVSDSQDYKRSESLIRQLEVEFGLEQVQSSHLLNKEKEKDHIKAPTLGELAMFDKTGKVPPRYFIADKIDDIIKKAGGKVSASDFIKQLQAVGIEPMANVQSTGRLAGFSFKYDGIKFTGEKVGQQYKWGNLKERVEYVQSRDFECCASTKIGTEFKHDIEDELRARNNGERTEADIKRIDEDIRREEALAKQQQVAKQQADRDREDKRSVVISDKNSIDSGWWTSSDIANRIVYDAIKSQIDLFQCDTFSLRLLRRDSDEAPQTRTFTREQLLNPKTISWLRYQNMSKEILFRPLSNRYIMLDDVKKSDLRKLYIHGLKPCAVVETSNDNHQVWLDIGRELLAAIIEFLLRLIGIEVDLSGAYADKAALTKDRYGKLAGFTNRKPEREYIENGQVRAPFIKLIYTKPGEVPLQMPKLIAQATIDAAQHEAKKANKPKTPIYNKVQREEVIHSFFAKKLSELSTGDQSRTDFRAVCAALAAGYNPDDVAAVLQAHRTDKKNPEYYARHTVENAIKCLETKQNQAPESEQYDAMQPS